MDRHGGPWVMGYGFWIWVDLGMTELGVDLGVDRHGSEILDLGVDFGFGISVTKLGVDSGFGIGVDWRRSKIEDRGGSVGLGQ